MMESKRRLAAEQNMLAGYNCAQAVFLAFAEDVGLDETTAARLMSGFGGGMGGLREVCGAVSAMVAVAGMLTGYDDPADKDGKAAEYREIRALADAFCERNDTIICRELLEGEAARAQRDPYPRTPAYYAERPCVKLVGDAAELVERYCAEHGVLQAQTGDAARENAYQI